MTLRVEPQNQINYSTPIAGNKLGCFYIHGRRATSIKETAQALTKLSESEEEEKLFLDVLKKIDPRIKRIRAGIQETFPVVLVDVGLQRMIPIHLLGDGFCRVSLILTGIMGSNSQSIVVDEIDSGLHHSTMKKFWKDLIQLTQQFGVQLFVSTHSEEMLYATLEAFEQSPELLRIFRVERDQEESTQIQKYDYALFRDSERAGFEIR